MVWLGDLWASRNQSPSLSLFACFEGTVSLPANPFTPKCEYIILYVSVRWFGWETCGSLGTRPLGEMYSLRIRLYRKKREEEREREREREKLKTCFLGVMGFSIKLFITSYTYHKWLYAKSIYVTYIRLSPSAADSDKPLVGHIVGKKSGGTNGGPSLPFSLRLSLSMCLSKWGFHVCCVLVLSTDPFHPMCHNLRNTERKTEREIERERDHA